MYNAHITFFIRYSNEDTKHPIQATHDVSILTFIIACGQSDTECLYL